MKCLPECKSWMCVCMSVFFFISIILMCACKIIGNVLPTQLGHTYKQYDTTLNRVHYELNRSASGENAVM